MFLFLICKFKGRVFMLWFFVFLVLSRVFGIELGLISFCVMIERMNVLEKLFSDIRISIFCVKYRNGIV